MFIESIFDQFWWPCDIKIDINICEPHCVTLFLVNLLHSPDVWIFDIGHLFDNLTSVDIFLTIWHLFDILAQTCNLNHLSQSQGYFCSVMNLLVLNINEQNNEILKQQSLKKASKLMNFEIRYECWFWTTIKTKLWSWVMISRKKALYCFSQSLICLFLALINDHS